MSGMPPDTTVIAPIHRRRAPGHRRRAPGRASMAAICRVAAFVVVSMARAEAQRPPDEIVTIRHLDRVVRSDGQVVDCEILTPNASVGQTLRVRIRTVTTDLRPEEVSEIIPRRTPREAYDNWSKWLRRERGPATGSIRTPRARAEAELALALWCTSPHPELDAEPPMDDRALEHLMNAARVDPSLADVWPHLIARFQRESSLAEAPIETLDKELEFLLIAREAGHSFAEIDFRIARILLERLAVPARAVPYLERVLAEPSAGGSSAAGIRRQARSLLSRALVGIGREAEALELWAPDLDGDPLAPERFDALWESAEILLRLGNPQRLARARELLSQAAAVQPEFPGVELRLAALDYADGLYPAARKRLEGYLSGAGGTDAAARVDLALVEIATGRFAKAEHALREVLAQVSGGATAVRAHLAVGSIAELRGDLTRAAASYEAALRLDDGDVVATLLVAAVRLRSGQPQEAGLLLTALAERHAGSRAVFGACSRLFASVDAAQGDLARAGARLEFAADTSPNDAAALEAAGLALLAQEKVERGLGYLSRAHAIDATRPATLAGLGFYHYRQGDRQRASRLFDEALAALAKRPSGGADSDDQRATRAWTTHARALLRDLERLEVWVDGFDASDDGLIDGWEEIELYGVEVAARDGVVVFDGRQQNTPEGETGIRLLRSYSSADVERVAVRVRVEKGRVAPLLRLGGPQGSRAALAALEVYRDFDGRTRFRTRDARGEWNDPDASAAGAEGGASTGGDTGTAASARASDALVYSGGIPWPDDRGFHTLEIRRAEGPARNTKRSVFDLLLDGEPIARNVLVNGLSNDYELGVWARTDALDSEYTVAVDDFKVYRVRKGAKQSP